MKSNINYYLVLLLFNALNQINGDCSEVGKWMRELTLGNKGDEMIIKWSFTNDILTMMMIGQTKGYISTGFAPKHEMKEADIVVGWVVDGQPYLQDRYSSKGEEPVLDEKQSLSLLGGGENDTHTFLCFERQLNTCDEQDFAIQNGTVNLLWALSENDPVDVNGTLQYLSTKRGIQFVYLLAIDYPKPTSKEIENFDIVPRKNVTVKSGLSDDTLYWCMNFKFPPFDAPRYMLGHEMLIPANNKEYMHHALLYMCKPDEAAKVYDEIDPNGYNCVSSESSTYRNPCNTLLVIWAVGNTELYLPEKLGIPFGNNTGDFYLKLELHYTMPKQQIVITDNTTIRLLLTKERPQFEAGIFTVGFEITPVHLIPPQQKAFSTVAVCAGSCLEQSFPPDGAINVIAIRYHAHLAGKKLRLHIYRNNTKLLTLSDDHADFHFQGFRFLPQELKLYSTDSFVSECVFDTTDRNRTTIGSFPTQQEMCDPDLIYYPRMELSWCMSFADRQQIFNLTGIEEVKNTTEARGCEGHGCDTIYLYPGIGPQDVVVKPEQFANQTLETHMKNFNNWTEARVNQLRDIYYLPQTIICLADFAPLNIKDLVPVAFPKSISKGQSFEPPNTCSN